MEDTIIVQRDGAIATVVLNRPEKLNALTRPMWRRLGEAFTELSADETLRCVILRGAGTKAFAPGNDISEFATERSNVAQARTYFTKAIEIDPSKADGYYYRGLSYLNAKKNAEAKADFKKYLELAPDGSEAKEAREILQTLK